MELFPKIYEAEKNPHAPTLHPLSNTNTKDKGLESWIKSKKSNWSNWYKNKKVKKETQEKKQKMNKSKKRKKRKKNISILNFVINWEFL